jgi:hypothetical protein
MSLSPEIEPSGDEQVREGPSAFAGTAKRRKVAPRELDCISFADRENAQPLNLQREARSEGAQALVDRVLSEVDSCGVIKPRPSSRQAARTAVAALIGGLMEREANGTWAAHGMSKAAFVGCGFGYDIFRPVAETMRALGYLEIAIGKARWHTWEAGTPAAPKEVVTGSAFRSTRFRMAPDLVALAHSFGIVPVEWKVHWPSGKPRKVRVTPEQPRLILKTHKVRRGQFKLDAKEMSYDPTEQRPAALLANIEAANAYLSRQAIGGIGFPGLRRIFNEGDQPGFAWQWGGRWFSLKGGDHYETMSREERFERLRINGECIGEADFRASHLTLLHALLGKPGDFAHDPYAVEGVGRHAVKAWVSHALGSGNVSFKRWSPTARDKYAEALPGRDLAEDYKPSDVAGAALRRYPVLAGLPSYGIGTLDLQYHEAEILGHAMAILRDREDVPALPLHDALIVPLSQLEAAGEALKEAFVSYNREEIGHPSPVPPMVKLEDQ